MTPTVITASARSAITATRLFRPTSVRYSRGARSTAATASAEIPTRPSTVGTLT